MNRTYTLLLLVSLLGLMPACGDHGHSHDQADGQGHDDHGSTGERPTVAVTHWTNRSELFMEYPVFVAGESGRSAIHVTDLTDFSPLSAGEAVVVLRGRAVVSSSSATDRLVQESSGSTWRSNEPAFTTCRCGSRPRAYKTFTSWGRSRCTRRERRFPPKRRRGRRSRSSKSSSGRSSSGRRPWPREASGRASRCRQRFSRGRAAMRC